MSFLGATIFLRFGTVSHVNSMISVGERPRSKHQVYIWYEIHVYTVLSGHLDAQSGDQGVMA